MQNTISDPKWNTKKLNSTAQPLAISVGTINLLRLHTHTHGWSWMIMDAAFDSSSHHRSVHPWVDLSNTSATVVVVWVLAHPRSSHHHWENQNGSVSWCEVWSKKNLQRKFQPLGKSKRERFMMQSLIQKTLQHKFQHKYLHMSALKNWACWSATIFSILSLKDSRPWCSCRRNPYWSQSNTIWYLYILVTSCYNGLQCDATIWIWNVQSNTKRPSAGAFRSATPKRIHELALGNVAICCNDMQQKMQK